MKEKVYSMFVILAGMCWGVMSIFVRKLTAIGFDPMQITMVRMWTGVLLIAVFVFFYNKQCFKIKLKDLPIFAGIGIFSSLTMSYMYFAAMVEIPVSVAAILLYTAPIWVLIVSVIFFKENLTKEKIIALILAFGGCVCVSGFSGGKMSVIGIIYAVISGLAYAAYSIAGKVVTKKYSPMTITLYSFIFAAIGSMFICDFGGAVRLTVQSFDTRMFMLILGLGAVSMALPFSLYTIGLSGIPAGKAAIMASVEPMMATLVGFFVFDESLSILGIFGITAILAAIILLNVKKES